MSGCLMCASSSEELDSAPRDDVLKSQRAKKVGAVDLLRRGPAVWLESRPPTLRSSMGDTGELFASVTLAHVSKDVAEFNCLTLRLVWFCSSVGHSNTNSQVAWRGLRSTQSC